MRRNEKGGFRVDILVMILISTSECFCPNVIPIRIKEKFREGGNVSNCYL
jgi:hypothetical protein